MQFTLEDVFSNIDRAANALPIASAAKRVRFGEYPSVFKGRGPDFYQISEYNPEEHEVDQIQWHLTDPDGTVYVREAKITKDFTVVVMADLSSSMLFKLRLLFETIGNVGLTCSYAQDPMGFIGFANDIIFDETSKIGEEAVDNLVENLYDFFEGLEKDGEGLLRGRADFVKAFEFFSSRHDNNQCFLVVVSDFIGAEEFVKSQLLKDVTSRHETVFLFLDNPSEFKVRGWLWRRLKMRDIETGRDNVVSPGDMKKLEQEIRAERKRMRDYLNDIGIGEMVLEYSNNGKHYERLLRFFLERQEMIKSGDIMI
ncbi:MAG: hypothetical protein A2750_02320 [Candidatus Yanofskybacteria bacterium RIFCSPHIGHO2_01_FULL_45_42]|uniref:DUF58 domain-containing protein n=2 Tax=Candidatus Yanofskyibacteriota TaxID=1752733 RepID=A0A1F8FPW5_9BACT|nr:MAG: hypothetical protein A2750_02320 [Candidatus Yanofskybacteria bacterium RIFCSPHIGHO2_01_FULL_45_42]OGN15115.1 MAG: hypothetical protein A3J47_00585 [Candidatus Yanofskybacteria bacterium RIFCSPHIGHO2_02_FULL_43_22]